MEIPPQLGLGKIKTGSSFLVLPDKTYQPIQLPSNSSQLTLAWQKGQPPFDYTIITNFKKNPTVHLANITDPVRLDYLHKENRFADFDREPLIPHMLSTEGPALAVGDLNND